MESLDKMNKVVKNIENMNEFESRKLWKIVADNMVEKNYNVANQEKRKIEQIQRDRIKGLSENQLDYESKFFDLSILHKPKLKNKKIIY